MKLKQFTILLLLILLYSCNQSNHKNTTFIKGQVKNKKTIDSVYIKNKGYPLDEQGNFNIHLKIGNERFITLNAGQSIYLFIRPNDTLGLIINKEVAFTGNLSGENKNLHHHNKLFDSINKTVNKMALYNGSFNRCNHTLDSLMQYFTYPGSLSHDYFDMEKKRVRFFFASILEQYPFWHMVNLRKNEPVIPNNFSQTLPTKETLNNPVNMALDQFKSYLKTMLDMRAKISIEIDQKGTLKHQNHIFTNYQLDVIDQTIKDKTIKNYLLKEVMLKHLDKYGTVSHDDLLTRFNSMCTCDTTINLIYKSFLEALQKNPDHFTKIYKRVAGHELKAYIFSKNKKPKNKKPAIIFYFGGGWYEGKPEQFFKFCKSFSDSGFVAISIDYRTKGRHNATPVEGLKDCKSAIRWVKKNAGKFHIDTAKIISSGWSAGGHLASSVSLIDSFNATTDNKSISAKTSACLLLAPGIDNTSNTWFYYTLDEKATPKQLMPLYHVKSNLPPHLVMFGTEDIFTKKKDIKPFQKKMQKYGNTCEIVIYQGLRHHDLFTPKTLKKMMDFLRKNNLAI